jgi:predicted amidohydrolase YtcJ
MCVACIPAAAALARGTPKEVAGPSAHRADLPAGAPQVVGVATPAVCGEEERSVILRGGPIVTVDDAYPFAEAIALRGPCIVAVGSATDIKRHYTAATEIVDLDGRAVLPGFVEPHVHVLTSALAAAEIDTATAAELFAKEPARLRQLCADTLCDFAARGCTTIYDASIGVLGGAAEYELLRALAHAPDAPVRVRGAFTPELARALDISPGAGDDRFDVVGVAYHADGDVQDHGAALVEPYADGHANGALQYDERELCDALRAWHDAGWQLVVHSNGDGAHGQVLRCFEAIVGASEPVGPVEHRIEHFTLASEEHTAQAATLGLSLSHPINDIYFWGETFRDRILGPARAARIHTLARDLEHDICTSCHGGPVVDPLLCLRTAATRLMRDSDDVLGPFQQLDLMQALRTLTRNPARQVLLGDRVGMLRPGMLADLVVLDRDPRAVAPERLHELRVHETWLAGRRQRWV